MKTIKVMRDGRPATAEELQCAVDGKPLPPSDCWAARLQELKHRQTEDRLRRCDEMLTMAGVPEWVMNSENDGVPANSTPDRLRWYLARRKDINPREVDQELQRDMRKWLDYVAQHNDRTERPERT